MAASLALLVAAERPGWRRRDGPMIWLSDTASACIVGREKLRLKHEKRTTATGTETNSFTSTTEAKMGFVPPPAYTGDPRTDWPRLRAWQRRQERTRAIGLMLVGASLLALLIVYLLSVLSEVYY